MRPAISTLVVDDERRGAHHPVGCDLGVVGDLLDLLWASEFGERLLGEAGEPLAVVASGAEHLDRGHGRCSFQRTALKRKPIATIPVATTLT